MIDPAVYDAAIDERTALVSSCHGYYMNGFVQDVGRIAARARESGALSFVDAYQTLGTVPVDVKALGVDFLAAGCLKFLMGIPGIAFLYVRPEIVDTLRPTVTGWFGRANPFGFDAKSLDWSPTASRFDTGTPPVINAYVARAGMSIVNDVGPSSIRAWLEVLGERLIAGGRTRGLTLHGTSDLRRKTATTAYVVGDSHAVEAAMRARGVIASARGSVIRLAPHFYNTIDDVDRALDLLADVARAD
jgi:selenocysteine lyase/cysteine desulfurase